MRGVERVRETTEGRKEGRRERKFDEGEGGERDEVVGKKKLGKTQNRVSDESDTYEKKKKEKNLWLNGKRKKIGKCIACCSMHKYRNKNMICSDMVRQKKLVPSSASPNAPGSTHAWYTPYGMFEFGRFC